MTEEEQELEEECERERYLFLNYNVPLLQLHHGSSNSLGVFCSCKHLRKLITRRFLIVIPIRLNNSISTLFVSEEQQKRDAVDPAAFHNVVFSYDSDSTPSTEVLSSQDATSAALSNQEPYYDPTFVLPEQLQSMSEIAVPRSRRQYDIIQKTALFLKDQDDQACNCVFPCEHECVSIKFLVATFSSQSV